MRHLRIIGFVIVTFIASFGMGADTSKNLSSLKNCILKSNLQCITNLSEYLAENINNDTFLAFAILNNKVSSFSRILQLKKVDINSTNKLGITALHWAVSSRNIPILKLILAEENIDVNKLDSLGRTPLSISTDVATAKLLIAKEAKLYLKGQSSHGLIKAIKIKNMELINFYFANKNLNYDFVDDMNKGFLYYFLKNDFHELARKLIFQNSTDLYVGKDDILISLEKDNVEVLNKLLFRDDLEFEFSEKQLQNLVSLAVEKDNFFILYRLVLKQVDLNIDLDIFNSAMTKEDIYSLGYFLFTVGNDRDNKVFTEIIKSHSVFLELVRDTKFTEKNKANVIKVFLEYEDYPTLGFALVDYFLYYAKPFDQLKNSHLQKLLLKIVKQSDYNLGFYLLNALFDSNKKCSFRFLWIFEEVFTDFPEAKFNPLVLELLNEANEGVLQNYLFNQLNNFELYTDEMFRLLKSNKSLNSSLVRKIENFVSVGSDGKLNNKSMDLLIVRALSDDYDVADKAMRTILGDFSPEEFTALKKYFDSNLEKNNPGADSTWGNYTKDSLDYFQLFLQKDTRVLQELIK